MVLAIVTGLLTGAGFGLVLYKVGATRYSRIMGMLTLRDTKVMKFAFTAIATASLWYGLAAALGVAESWNLVPRVMPFFGWGHVLGGVLFGAALGTTGQCPGTCVAKAGGRGGAKKFAAPASIVGLFTGIFVYAALKQPLAESGIVAANQKPMTLHGLLGLPYAATALLFGAVMVLVAFAVDRLTPEAPFHPSKERKSVIDYVRGEWSWIASGVVGGTLVVAATAQHGYLGFSGALLALVGSLAHLVGMPMELVPVINEEIAWRAALMVGVFPGALLAKWFSMPSAPAAEAMAQGAVQKVLDPKAIGISFASGTTLALGAMIGGGCTTGAFIAAWPTLSVGSFTMAGTFFAVSMAVSATRSALRAYDLKQLQLAGDRVYD